ncbi:MAG TPA: hypothetical protein VNH19_01155 [Candidatus Limnocylindrales bacterium]|jgi:hypothetical protein|nr:hypothetical protein [Candidatus Limnocylindrales bacterium]
MFCPVCKTEYREGFKTCSDCHVELVDDLPVYDSPEAFAALWSGENTAFQDRLLQELEQAKIGAVGIPRDVLFKGAGDALGVRREPRFGFAVCVRSADMPAASRILERLLEQEPGESAPEAESIPLSAEEAEVTAELPLNWNPETAAVEVWKGEEECQLKFIEDSLGGVGVPTRRMAEKGGPVRIMIRPQDEARGEEVVRQILENTVPEKPLPGDLSYAWLDERVQSFSLLWAIVTVDILLVFLALGYPELQVRSGSLLDVIATLIGGAADLGALWLFYQAARYEIRPFWFVVAVLLPYSFVWYYFERYSKRTGVRRLPVAMRIRLSPPPSA